MTPDEAYRLALLAYPAAWRAEHSEEVLGLLLEAKPPRADRREVVGLVGHGIAARLRRTAEPGRLAPGSTTAALALGSLAGFALLAFFWGEWWPWPTSESAFLPERTFFTAGGLLWPLLILPALLMVSGARRAGRAATAVGLVGTLAAGTVAPFTALGRPPLYTLLPAFALLVLGRLGKAPVDGPARLLTLLTSVAVGGGGSWLLLSQADLSFDSRAGFYYGGWGTSLLAPWIALVVVTAFVVAHRHRRAVALVGLPWLVLASATWTGRGSPTVGLPGTRLAALTLIVVMVAIMAVAAVRAPAHSSG